MPITSSAKKKLKQDIKRQKANSAVKKAASSAMKAFRKNPSEKLLQNAFSLLDKMQKKNLFHKNKAARLKSSLSKLIGGKKKEAAANVKKKPSKKK